MKSILKYFVSILLTNSKTGRAGAEFKMWQTGCLIPRVWLLVGLWLALFFFWGSGRGIEGGLLIFLTKYQNYRPLKNFRRGCEFGNSIFHRPAALDMLYSLFGLFTCCFHRQVKICSDASRTG